MKNQTAMSGCQNGMAVSGIGVNKSRAKQARMLPRSKEIYKPGVDAGVQYFS